MQTMQHPAVGTLKDVGGLVSDPGGLAILLMSGTAGAVVGGGLGWALGWPLNKSMIAGGAVAALGLVALIVLSPAPKQPVPIHGYVYR